MRTSSLLISAVAFSLFGAATAHAHIDMVGALKSRGGDQKSSPCDGERGDGPVYTFAPGATITLEVKETIPHPGYYRIAFDNDGDDGFVEPKSIKPVDPNRKCPYDGKDQCGQSDFCNVVSSSGATVLWDNVYPHLSRDAKDQKWTIKLPDVECENCTIQVLQIMEDTVHGAYCPTGSCMDNSLEDIYHRCIDIKLVKGAPNGPGTGTGAPPAAPAMNCLGNAPNPPSGGDAGASTADAGTSGGSGVDAGVALDSGTSKPRDAAVAPEPPKGGDDDDDDEAAPIPAKDAGSATRRDAGKAPSSDDDDEPSDDEEEPTADDDEDEPAAAASDDGCSTSPGRSAGSASLLTLLGAALLLRSRRRRG